MFKRVNKKIIVFLEVFFLLMSMITWTPLWAKIAYAAGSAPTGSGTAGDPYLISSKDNLIWLSDQVNGGTTFSGEFFKQQNDINLTSDGTSSGTPIDWTPIGWFQQSGGGAGSAAFSGTYDGDKHYINKLKINKSASAEQNPCLGLFGDCSVATIKNIRVQNASITCSENLTSGQVGYIGGICGLADNTTITNCSLNGNITLTATGGGYYVGGLVGYITIGSINSCYNEGIVSATAGANCSPAIVGGIVGNMDSVNLMDCYNTGSISNINNGNDAGYLGGISGCAIDMSGGSGIIQNCYNVGSIQMTNNSGINSYIANIGVYDGGSISGCYYLSGKVISYGTNTIISTMDGSNNNDANMKTAATFSGWDPGIWILQNGQYPILGASPLAVVTATSSGIATATGTTTITLGQAISGLSASDIVVKKGGVALTSGTDYTLGTLTGTTVDITFAGSAGLTNTSVVTVEITKTGYTINSGSAISVANTIPAPPTAVTATSSGIATATGTTTITLGQAISGLSASDIVVKKGGVALTSGTNYTLGTLTGTTFDITFAGSAGLTNTSVITVEITKTGYTINGGSAISVANTIAAPPTVVTATSNGIATATGTTTITLDQAISGLSASDIVVKKGGVALTSGTNYTLGTLTGTTFDITFAGSAALTNTSVITVEITKTGYTINGGSAISVANTIAAPPTVVTASSNGIATATGTTTITLDQAISGLSASDIVVKKGGVALASGTNYTLGTLTGTTFDITFAGSAGLTNTSVITVEITKTGYTINGGSAISVANTIAAPPTVVTATSNGIATATGTTTITLDQAISGLSASDIVVKKGGVALTSGTDYTLGTLTGTTFDITFAGSAALTNASVVTVEITKTGYTINGGSAISVANTIAAPPTAVTATSNGIATATGTTTITLGQAISGLSASDIVVKKGGVALTSGTDYTLGTLTGTTFDITFAGSAGLTNTSVITVEITKTGYTINGGSAIAVANTIAGAPTAVTASSNGIATATGTTTITLGQAISGLSASDIVVKKGGIALTSGTNYTLGTLTGTTFDITFAGSSGLTNTSVITVEITKTGYTINGGSAIAVANTIAGVPTAVTASSNGIATATGTTTITLGQAISGLSASDIVVKKGGVALTSGTNYTLGTLTGTTFDITFAGSAGLTNTSVVTVEITKTGYTINGGSAIAVVNTISGLSTAPLASDITVTNNIAGTDDTIAVANVPAGATVKAYDASGNLLGTVTNGGSSAATQTIYVTQLGTGSGSVYVTITEIGKAESTPRTQKAYTAEPIVPITYTLTYTAEAGGRIDGNTSQTVNSGGNGAAVTAVANSGYHFTSWSDGNSYASRRDMNVAININVIAGFELNLPSNTDTTPVAVRIIGTGQVNNTLEAQLIDVNGADVTTSAAVTYRWYRIPSEDSEGGTLIGEDKIYRVVSDDAGSYIKLVVSYIDEHFRRITSRILGNTSNNTNSSGTKKSNSSSTEQITVKVTDGSNDTPVSETVIERTTASDGTKKDTITYTADKAKETIAALTSAGKDTARIVAADSDPSVSETQVNIPKETLSALSSGNVNLQIETGGAIVSVPKESVQGLAGSGQLNGDLYFRLVPINDTTRQTEIKTTADKEVAVKLVTGNKGVQLLGTPMTIETNMSQRDVDIVLPLKGVIIPTNPNERQAFLNDLGVFIEHSDGEKVLEKGQVVEYSPGVFGIKFTVKKFSDFTIVKLNKSNKTGWVKDNGYWYFFNKAGTMITGWYKSENGDWTFDGKDTVGQWFHLGKDGKMDMGWFKDTDGSWYFLCDGNDYGALGYMETGWKLSNGKWYFLKENGAMASNTVVDGYTLGSDGAWVQ
ncbi:beta strand repeat-containing protein [Clostridium saccharoperbutylacetonicum]